MPLEHRRPGEEIQGEEKVGSREEGAMDDRDPLGVRGRTRVAGEAGVETSTGEKEGENRGGRATGEAGDLEEVTGIAPDAVGKGGVRRGVEEEKGSSQVVRVPERATKKGKTKDRMLAPKCFLLHSSGRLRASALNKQKTQATKASRPVLLQ